MIFSKKETTLSYTVEICQKCKKSNRRDFYEGDILFTSSSKCAFCDGITVIEKIYGEILKR